MRTLLLVVLLAPSPAPAQVRPNDPLFHRQVSVHRDGGTAVMDGRFHRPSADTIVIAPGVHLDLPRAWTITTGSRAVIVAVLDDGFFYGHEDVAANVWRNPGETGLDDRGYPRATNGRDDDGNGYVDDVMGWDFAFGDPDPDPYVFDGMDATRIQPYWHAIPALGIIGAVGNNGVGVAGINWDVSLMLLKIGAQGIGRGQRDTLRPGRAALAIRYAVDNGARVINWSGFVSVTEERFLGPLRDAIRYAAEHDVLLVTGAGNDALDLDTAAACPYPQCFDLPNQIRVAQLGLDGGLYRYQTADGAWRGSNFGARRVEIAAIGENYTTGLVQGRSTYWLSNGTSNAGPVVAGVAALVLAVRPDLSARDLKRILMDSAVRRPALEGRVASGGVVNAFRALTMATGRDPDR